MAGNIDMKKLRHCHPMYYLKNLN